MLAALAVLLALGTWQMQRKAWKEGLVAAIAQRVSAEPVPLAAALGRWRQGENLEYLRVRARGRYLNDKERFFYAPSKEGPGFHVYTPLELTDGQILLVNRGFVPEDLKTATRRGESPISDETEVVGLLRGPGERNWFTPENEPAKNLWFWRDLTGMAAGLGPKASAVVPFFVDREAGLSAAWPRGGVTHLDLPNRHLEYALTWYGLAATLVGVYLAFAYARLKQA
jgi:surfeit locus 1 family protein